MFALPKLCWSGRVRETLVEERDGSLLGLWEKEEARLVATAVFGMKRARGGACGGSVGSTPNGWTWARHVRRARGITTGSSPCDHHPLQKSESVQSAIISLSSPPEQTTLEPDHSQRQRTMLGLSIAPTLTPKPTLYAIPKPVFNGVRIAHVCTTRHFSARHPRALVVTMAKREEELKEIRKKPTEQLNDEIVELKGELFMLRLQRSARNEFKSSEFRRMRKRVLRDEGERIHINPTPDGSYLMVKSSEFCPMRKRVR
ncbi:hypothetical protein Acr_05g0010630 [Actinidia rufa]|uniref:Large ribosomal subunit protein uL29c n=1 Tax=Actinidia rufa TaxID=165716 RepID=A0A7J0ELS6_9ERIC|nr:hypothetical protein Acr_05g0010630 [Actinidia rufa]